MHAHTHTQTRTRRKRHPKFCQNPVLQGTTNRQSTPHESFRGHIDRPVWKRSPVFRIELANSPRPMPERIVYTNGYLSHSASGLPNLLESLRQAMPAHSPPTAPSQSLLRCPARTPGIASFSNACLAVSAVARRCGWRRCRFTATALPARKPVDGAKAAVAHQLSFG